MRYLSLGEVLELHRQLVQQAGCAAQIHDMGVLSSAVAQPRMTFAIKNFIHQLRRRRPHSVFR
jgi:prophage maintenance system killer protein